MKILILNWRDPKHPFAGGAERSVLEHVKYWQKKGADITWFAASFKGAMREEEVEGLKIIRSGNHYTVHLNFIIYRLLGKFKNIELVVDCFHFIPFFTPLLFPYKKKIALIQETGGKLWFDNTFFPLSIIGYLLEPVFFKFYRNMPIITASESAKKEIMDMGIKEKNITIISHGVDRINTVRKKEKNPTILYLGLLSRDKGFEDACIAVSLVKKQIPNLNFWVVGKEIKKGDFNWFAGPAKSFAKYFGFVDEKKKFELFNKAWILVHASSKEGWGLTVIEAATQGTPTVGYDVPGLRDSIKNHVTGLLTSKSPTDLAIAIQILIHNPSKLHKMEKSAKAWSEGFTWDKAGKESWKLIATLPAA